MQYVHLTHSIVHTYYQNLNIIQCPFILLFFFKIHTYDTYFMWNLLLFFFLVFFLFKATQRNECYLCASNKKFVLRPFTSFWWKYHHNIYRAHQFRPSDKFYNEGYLTTIIAKWLIFSNRLSKMRQPKRKAEKKKKKTKILHSVYSK